MISNIAYQLREDEEHAHEAREEAISERASEIVTESCTTLEVSFTEALENLQEKETATAIAACVRCIRKAPRKVEREIHCQQLGELVADKIAAYMNPIAEFSARKEFGE